MLPSITSNMATHRRTARSYKSTLPEPTCRGAALHHGDMATHAPIRMRQRQQLQQLLQPHDARQAAALHARTRQRPPSPESSSRHCIVKAQLVHYVCTRAPISTLGITKSSTICSWTRNASITGICITNDAKSNSSSSSCASTSARSGSGSRCSGLCELQWRLEVVLQKLLRAQQRRWLGPCRHRQALLWLH